MGAGGQTLGQAVGGLGTHPDSALVNEGPLQLVPGLALPAPCPA